MNISVVIPTYNYAGFLPEAIDSVLNQTLAPGEIIVADDGSTDDTAAVAARYGDRIRYIRFDHIGVYAVRQKLLSEIKGDWFFNLDADNFVEKDFLEVSAATAESAGDSCAFVYPDRITFGAYVRKSKVPEFDISLFKKKNFADMNSLIRTDAARKTGFDPGFNDGWGDYDFFLRLSKAGFTGRAQHESPLHYRVHSASITAATQASLDRKHDLMRRMTEKHKDFFTPEEAAAALRYFSRSAAMRQHVSSLVWEHRYLQAFLKALQYNFALFG